VEGTIPLLVQELEEIMAVGVAQVLVHLKQVLLALAVW
jgi:hypothetical protein